MKADTCANELVLLATLDLRSPISERPSIESPMLRITMMMMMMVMMMMMMMVTMHCNDG